MYDKINKIYNNIKKIKIQGATNIAYATIEGIELVVRYFKGDEKELKNKLKIIADKLSLARDNEPLARNAVKYVFSNIGKSKAAKLKDVILKSCTEYKGILSRSTEDIVKFGTEILKDAEIILTHCHSSSVINILKNLAKYKYINNGKLKIISTETRPFYQGRKTVIDLRKANIDVTQIVDSASAAFIVESYYCPVSSVLVGCDEILNDGSFINKIGTFSIAIAAQKGKDKFYVVSTLLKINPNKNIKNIKIEQRNASEVWKDAPRGVKIINPAFDKVPSEYITGYITEIGLVKPNSLLDSAKKVYPWIFN